MEAKIKRFSRYFILSILLELTIVFLGFKITKNNIDAESPVIRGDGKGYYDYLPALFIYHDLQFNFRNKPIEKYLPEQYSNLNIDYKGKVVNKYPCGEALIIAPLFFIAHGYCYVKGIEPNGFTNPYQDAVLVTALMMLIIGLYYAKRLLLLYDVPIHLVLLCTITFGFGSQIYYYSYLEGSYSHIHSFAAITTFLFFIKSYILKNKNKHLYIASFLLGLIFLIRPINILIILFLPFLFENWKAFVDEAKKLFIEKYKSLFVSFGIFFAVISIQFLLWFAQTGEFFVWSYQKEGFNFSKPYIMDALFSFKKGLFIYTPIFFFAILLYIFTNRKSFYHVSVFLLWFLLLIYITSSWHMWWYGMSFGLRPIMDFTAVFILIYGLSLKNSGRLILLPVTIVSAFCIYLLTVQSYQYRYFILHWDDMDYTKYKKVFLKTDYRYRGILWNNPTKNLSERYIEVKKERINKMIDLEVLKSNNQSGYYLAMEYFPETDIECKYIGVKYKVIDPGEDDIKILINILNSNNQSLSYDEFYLFHHLDISKSENENYCISPIGEAKANELRILFEMKQFSQSKTRKIIIEEIVYYI